MLIEINLKITILQIGNVRVLTNSLDASKICSSSNIFVSLNNYYGIGYNHDIWHSMRSSFEKTLYDANRGGISAEDAMLRGMSFGWYNIFRSAEKGKLGQLEINSMGIEQFGQGLHALQDAYAHRGRHDVSLDHLKNDRFGDTSEARKITQSAVMVHSIMSGDTGNFNKMLNGGINSLDLTGISGKNLIQLNNAVKANGNQLKYNWHSKMYDVK